jgi:hypothetical protein
LEKGKAGNLLQSQAVAADHILAPAGDDDRGIEASGQQNCAQIVPVKVKFSQILPKISKITVKISRIINMLKLGSF